MMIIWIYLVVICPALITFIEIDVGGVSIYYKESLPIKMLNSNYLQECISFNVKIGSKRYTIVSFYRSPSQSANEFENVLNKLNLTMESLTQKNPFLTVVIGNFNVRPSKWCMDDKATQQGFKIENLPSQFSLSQVINRPIHISQKLTSLHWSTSYKSKELRTREFILHFILIAIIVLETQG